MKAGLRLLAIAWAALALLSGCAGLVRQEADAQLRRGNYEAAIAQLEEGLRQYPDHPTLRTALLAARGDAVGRLLAEATQARSAGDLEGADLLLQRALQLEPRSERVLAMRDQLVAERRTLRTVAAARAQVEAGRKAAALAIVEAALKEAPRHPALVALQRELEADLRPEGDAPRRGLAETRPVTLDFRNAPLAAVLEAITRGSGVNFILDRDVRQDTRITVYLQSARVEDAIDLVAGAHQLARRIVDANTVLVYPNTPEKHREHQEQVIRVFHLANAEAKTSAALLRSMLRLREVFVDERANLIALREPADVVLLAERLLALHDVPDAEVMLAVEVLEVSATRLTELGLRVPDAVALTPLPANGTLTVQSLRDLNASRIGVGISPLVLNLRREVGDVNILANPRIRAKNREKAKILIGDKVPVITSTANATGFVSENVSYLDVGLKLEVEPTVSPDEDVSIRLGLEVSSIVREIRSASGTLAYQLGTRNANTVLRLHDGETQLLAGLISNEDRTAANRIPGLGDLPVAGRLFSSQKDDFRRTELVLAITPHVLRPAPRPAVAQAEMWVGTELSTRLRSTPLRGPAATADTGTQPAAQAPIAAAAVSSAPTPDAPVTTPAASPPAPMRLFWESPAGARVGQVLTIGLSVDGASGLRGLPVEIAYTPQTLEVLEVLEGDFLQQGGVRTSFTHALDAGGGRVNVGLLRNDPSGARGRGTLLRLRVKVLRAGAGEVSVAGARPVELAASNQALELPVLKLQLR